MAAQLRQKTTVGVAWSLLERAVFRGVGVLVTLVLAWFVVPESFALIAVVSVCLAFVNVIVDGGMTDALIRMRACSTSVLNTVFVCNLVAAVAMYAGLCAAAPFLAEFFRQPSLVRLLPVGALATLFYALSAVHRAQLVRKMNFRVQMRVSFPAAFCSGLIAILLAMLGFGVWALVFQIVLQAALQAALYWRVSDWRPQLKFHWQDFREIFAFSGFLLLARILNVPFRHMYVIVITRLYAPEVAGLYFFAERVRNLLLDQLVAAIQSVTYPALSSLQNDDARLKQGYRDIVATSAFLFAPLVIAVVVLAPLFVEVILPERWLSASPYLQLTILAGLLYPLHAVNINIMKVKRRADLVFWVGVVKKCMAVGVLLVSLRWGVMGVLVGQVINSFLSFLPNSYCSKRLLGYTSWEQVVDYAPSVLLAIAAGGFATGLQLLLDLTPVLALPMAAVAMLATYGSLAYLFGMRGLRFGLAILGDLSSRRSQSDC
ncbi:lipopolysaccharide biosynthesis protein [Mangrovimicrobium sediminis]|uniref:lipopolysaccharide biosynthesis protein n=1 Tax=Mangrovimicrobium sediminis TaxID=2562682 RepID=UPI001436B1DE|nr:lipopolysaccharide biosynthesis protein [Haliea sp. SAOS-164]